VTTSVDRVHHDIREAIIDGRFIPGSPLRLNRLTEEFGVSLIPIREALRRLEMERLVETSPNRGARVAGISADDVADVYSLRILLETEALTRAWPRLTEAVVDDLGRLRNDMARRLKKGDPVGYELHRRLHFDIYELSGSPWLLYLIQIMWSHTERYRKLAGQLKTFIDFPDDLHAHILDAVKKGSLEEAITFLTRDLERTAELVIGAHSDRDGDLDIA
jgi:DNA-binding GntR family transcriptional regulator